MTAFVEGSVRTLRSNLEHIAISVHRACSKLNAVKVGVIELNHAKLFTSDNNRQSHYQRRSRVLMSCGV